ncbi:MAG: tRNA 2-thiouridine(34) synthase MnmA [Puniceicoccales bacterium]|jgi:tRNA-specific 2-thiouridylase|nr:tRNA 2-thiouridine(34) synthase MnmA [Puniceicoccales bacterium]
MLRGKVAVAVSGGVDSSVAALLLKNDAYEVCGIFMRTWSAEDDATPISQCPWKVDLDDARAACDHLGIAFEVVNMIGNYRWLVAKELVEGYRLGITPNPDVLCNARIKFGALKEYAHGSGFEKFATGHYCRTVENSDGTVDILEGADKNKDQSYFLAMLSQEQIKNTLFPVGALNKPEVRKLAAAAALPNYKKKDSQGICFLGKVRLQDFLAGHIADAPGDIVDTDGKVLGKHRGLFRFTIGQRRGINLPSNLDFVHYVVIGKDLVKNHLIVEIERSDSKFLYAREFAIRGLSFTNRPIESDAKLLARPRYRDPACRVEFFRDGDSTARIVFEIPQRAIAPGQIAAFYEGETLVGGGVFSQSSP